VEDPRCQEKGEQECKYRWRAGRCAAAFGSCPIFPDEVHRPHTASTHGMRSTFRSWIPDTRRYQTLGELALGDVGGNETERVQARSDALPSAVATASTGLISPATNSDAR
jgi:hypothetical protein